VSDASPSRAIKPYFEVDLVPETPAVQFSQPLSCAVSLGIFICVCVTNIQAYTSPVLFHSSHLGVLHVIIGSRLPRPVLFSNAIIRLTCVPKRKLDFSDSICTIYAPSSLFKSAAHDSRLSYPVYLAHVY